MMQKIKYQNYCFWNLPSNGELKPSSCWSWDSLLFGLSSVFSSFSTSHFGKYVKKLCQLQTNTNLFSNWASSKPATKLLRIRPIPALVPNPLDQSETSLQMLVRAVVDWVQWRSHFLRDGPKKWRHGVTGGQFAASFHYLGPGELDSYSFSHPSPTLPFSIPARWCSNLPLVMWVGAITLYAMGHIAVILYLPPF